VSLMPAKRELVSILIPIFNEEDGVELLKEKLLGLQNLLENEYELEFLFIDDGSSDLTVPRLRKSFRDAAITTRILQHGVNQGVGAAFRTGFQKAQGDYVCTIDADCTYSPEGLQQLLSALKSSGADIAVASPYHPDGGVEGVAAWRLVLSKGCSMLYRFFSPLKLYTYTSIFRAYRGDVVRNVQFRGNGFVSASEILIAAGRQGYTVTEIPMVLRARSVGRSKMKVLRTIASHLEMLFSFAGSISAAPPRRPAARVRGTLVSTRVTATNNKDPFAA
jgi:dolichol-phosphate mannosyltransferase